MGFRPLAAVLLLAVCATAEDPQSPSYTEQRQQAAALLKAGEAFKAVPVLEKLESENSKDDWVAEWLATAYFISAQNEPDSAKRAELVTRARDEANRSKNLGRNTDTLKSLLSSLSGKDPFLQRSGNPAVAEWMRKGELAFGNGDHKAALEDYAKALDIDPKLYNAALFSGDVYFRERDWDRAAGWFQRAITIDPNLDTAYRYWADALLAQNKLGDAKALYIDAVLAQPYTRPPWQALNGWAKRSNFKAAPPQIQIPDSALEEDGSGRSAWSAYFAQPSRHSLAEQTEALRSALSALVEKKIASAKLDPQLAELARLEKAGLLEAWLLLSHADDSIAKDYIAYRTVHRAELQRYIDEEVLKPL